MNYLASIRAPRLLVSAVMAPVFFLPVGSLAQTAPSAPPRAAQPPAARPKPGPQPTAAQPPATQPAPTPGMTSAKASSSGDDVVARVGNADISAGDVRAYVSALGAREQAALAKDPALLS